MTTDCKVYNIFHYVLLAYDKCDVAELAEAPDVLHGGEAGAGMVPVVEHRRLGTVRHVHMLRLAQRTENKKKQ